MQWLRLHNETVNDPKWRMIAVETGQPVHAVLAVWTAMLCWASAAEPRGTLAGWNDRLTGAALDLKGAAVEAIRAEMQGVVLDGDQLTAWEKRQFKSDDVNERVKRYRSKKSAQTGNRNVTSAENGERNHGVTLQTTDETLQPLRATDSRIQNLSLTGEIDSTGQMPLGHDPSADKTNLRSDGPQPTDERSDDPLRSIPDPQRQDPNELFGEWWVHVPRKVSKGQAEKAYRAALKHATPEELLTGIQRYAAQAAEADPRFIAHPTTWLNGKRWLDEPVLPLERAHAQSDQCPRQYPSKSANSTGNGWADAALDFARSRT